jgi:hypothetical protein
MDLALKGSSIKLDKIIYHVISMNTKCFWMRLTWNEMFLNEIEWNVSKNRINSRSRSQVMLLIGSNVTLAETGGWQARAEGRGASRARTPLKHFNFFHYPEIKVALLHWFYFWFTIYSWHIVALLRGKKKI